MKHLLVYGIGSSFIMLIYNVVKYFAYTMFYYIPGLKFKGIRPKFINSWLNGVSHICKNESLIVPVLIKQYRRSSFLYLIFLLFIL